MKKNKYLIKNSTKEERIRYINEAIAISTLDSKGPTSFGKSLFQKYIDGEMELREVEKEMIKYYKQFGSN